MSLRIISGKYKNKALLGPKNEKTRPTSAKTRETIFNILGNEVDNALVLDLYAGSGALGLEALSRGASHVTFVEMDHDAKHAIYKNIENLCAQASAKLLGYDVKRALKTLVKRETQFDLIFIDPPYEFEKEYETTMQILDTCNLLKKDGIIVVEERAKRKRQTESLLLKNLKEVDSRTSGAAHLTMFRAK